MNTVNDYYDTFIKNLMEYIETTFKGSRSVIENKLKIISEFSEKMEITNLNLWYIENFFDNLVNGVEPNSTKAKEIAEAAISVVEKLLNRVKNTEGNLGSILLSRIKHFLTTAVKLDGSKGGEVAEVAKLFSLEFLEKLQSKKIDVRSYVSYECYDVRF